MNYRGDVKSKEANATVQWLKSYKKCFIVDICSSQTTFKIGLNEHIMPTVENDEIIQCVRNASMIANNCGMSRVINERICKQYDLLFSKRAYLHWYLNENMEETEMIEARENVGYLEKEYLEMAWTVSDEEYTDDEDY